MLAGFLLALIPQGASAMFGDQVIAMLPSGSELAEWIRNLVAWLSSPDAAFSYFALGFGAAIALLVWFQLLPLGTSVLVSLCFVAGVAFGVVSRVNDPGPIANFWLDPALWILLAGIVAPVALWGVYRGMVPLFSSLFELILERLEGSATRTDQRLGLEGEADSDLIMSEQRHHLLITLTPKHPESTR